MKNTVNIAHLDPGDTDTSEKTVLPKYTYYNWGPQSGTPQVQGANWNVETDNVVINTQPMASSSQTDASPQPQPP